MARTTPSLAQAASLDVFGARLPMRWWQAAIHRLAELTGDHAVPRRVGWFSTSSTSCLCVLFCMVQISRSGIWKYVSRLGIYKKCCIFRFLKIKTQHRHLHRSWLVQDDHALHVAISHIAQDLCPMSCRDLQLWKFNVLTYMTTSLTSMCLSVCKCGF